MGDWLAGLNDCNLDFIAEQTAGMSQSEAFRWKVNARNQHQDAIVRGAVAQQNLQASLRHVMMGGGNPAIESDSALTGPRTWRDVVIPTVGVNQGRLRELDRAMDYVLGNSETARELMDILIDNEVEIELRFNSSHITAFLPGRPARDGNPVVFWDPFSGLVLRNGDVISPASLLFHELAHEVEDLLDIDRSVAAEYESQNRRRINAAENANMAIWEQNISRELGEPVRSRYQDGFAPVHVENSAAWGTATMSRFLWIFFAIDVREYQGNQNPWVWDREN